MPNLSQWALRHQQLVGFMVAVAVIAGALSYFSLGRTEDPEFTVKAMLISVGWPGASANQMAEQVVKPIEDALTDNIPAIDFIRSKARPGQATLTVNRASTTPPDQVFDLWYTHGAAADAREPARQCRTLWRTARYDLDQRGGGRGGHHRRG